MRQGSKGSSVGGHTAPLTGTAAELWARYQAGDRLTSVEEADLRAAAGEAVWMDAVAEDAAFAAWLAELGVAERDPGFVARVERAVREREAGRKFALRPRTYAGGRRWRSLVVAVAGATAVAAAAVLVLRPRRTEPRSPTATAVLPVQTTGPLPATGVDLARPSPQRELPPVLHGVEVVPGLRPLKVVFAFDGDRWEPHGVSGRLRHGVRSRCPPGRPGTCVHAVRYQPPNTHGLGVQIHAGDGRLFPFGEDLYLRFEYWLGETTTGRARLEVEINDAHDRGVTDLIFTPGPPVTWNRVLVPLAALRRSEDPSSSPAPGTPVTFLQIVLRFAENDVLYVRGLDVVQLGR